MAYLRATQAGSRLPVCPDSTPPTRASLRGGSVSVAADRTRARPDGAVEVEAVRIDRSALEKQKSAGHGLRPGSVSNWALLIKRVYEFDPLECPHCRGQMKIVSFIGWGQQDVIERILRHCGLWEGPIRTLATARAPPRVAMPRPAVTGELDIVPDDEYLEYQRRENQENQPGELQMVFDPEFL